MMLIHSRRLNVIEKTICVSKMMQPWWRNTFRLLRSYNNIALLIIIVLVGGQHAAAAAPSTTSNPSIHPSIYPSTISLVLHRPIMLWNERTYDRFLSSSALAGTKRVLLRWLIREFGRNRINFLENYSIKMRLLYLQAKHYVRRRPLVDYIVALVYFCGPCRPPQGRTSARLLCGK